MWLQLQLDPSAHILTERVCLERRGKTACCTASQVTHVTDVDDPFPGFGHSVGRSGQYRQQQQEQRRTPPARLRSSRTRQMRHYLGEEMKDTEKNMRQQQLLGIRDNSLLGPTLPASGLMTQKNSAFSGQIERGGNSRTVFFKQ